MANFLSLSQSSKNAVLTLIVFVLAFDLAFVGQKLGGAYQNEFGGDRQEAAHFMAGLYWRDLAVSMWRDRVEGKRESLSEQKKAFTQNWTAHYPYLGAGSGRSLFHVLEGVWMLAFPATRGSLLILMAVIAGILATQVFRALQPEYGWAGAGLAAACLLVLPPIRKFTGLAMPDLLCGIFVFGAVMAYGNFLDREKARDIWLAGILGALAMLTREPGVDLVSVLGVATIAARKLRLLRRPAAWGTLVFLFFVSVCQRAWLPGDNVEVSLYSYVSQFASGLGWGVGALTVIGFLVAFARKGEFEGRWTVAGALLLFTVCSPIASRWPAVLRAALPAALMFALAGGAWVVRWVSSRPGWSGKGAKFRVSFAAVLGALVLVSATGPWRREACTGFAPLVETLIADSAPGDVTLVSSDPSGEERFIAELAAREQRPGHTVLCGTQILANPGKKFIADEPAFPGDQAVFEFLTSGKIKYIALDDDVPDEDRREHHYQLRRAIEEHLNRFWVIASCPVTRDGVTQSTPAKLYKIK